MGDPGAGPGGNPGSNPSSDPTDAVCGTDDQVCVDGNTLQFCDDGHLRTISCEGICGQSRPSYGCEEDSDDVGFCHCGEELDPCSEQGDQECVSDNTIRWCNGGVWEYWDCDRSCVEGGYQGAAYPDACEYSVESGLDVCMCSVDTCPWGSERCSGTNTLAWCGDYSSWNPVSCDELCGDAGLGYGLRCDYSHQLDGDACTCSG